MKRIVPLNILDECVLRCTFGRKHATGFETRAHNVSKKRQPTASQMELFRLLDHSQTNTLLLC